MSDLLIYAIYNTTTGEIKKVFGVLPDDTVTVPANVGSGEASSLETSVDPDTEYYVSGVKTTRPLMTTVATWDTTSITANGTSSATLGPSLPNPTNILVSFSIPSIDGSGTSITETSGSFSLTTVAAGSYTVTATAFPYQTYTTVITAS